MLHHPIDDDHVEVEVALEPDADAFRRLLAIAFGPDDDDDDDGPVAA